MSPASVCRTVAASPGLRGRGSTAPTAERAAWRWPPCTILAPTGVAVGAEAMARLYEDHII